MQNIRASSKITKMIGHRCDLSSRFSSCEIACYFNYELLGKSGVPGEGAMFV
jgi:hypothetical protein